jgi:hypothetical protein
MKSTLDSIQVLAALDNSTLSVKGLAEKLTGDSTSETEREVADTLSLLIDQDMVRAFEAHGVTWYETAEAPLVPRPSPKLDAGYADEDPGDGRPDRLYGN